MDSPIAITGASGFIGRALLASLLARGYRVRIHLRSTAFAPPGTGPGTPAVEIVRGNLADPSTWQQLNDGCRALVHLAGSVRGQRPAHFTIHQASVRALLEAATPQPLLLVSSLAAREPHLSHYANSKRQAEELLKADRSRAWTILRPTAVYGPGDRELLPLLTWMRRGLWLRLGPTDPANRLTLVHLYDLVELITNWLAEPRAFGHVLDVCDQNPRGYTWQDIHDAFYELTHRRGLVLPLPTAALRGWAMVGETLANLSGQRAMLTRGKVNELTWPSWACDLTPAQSHLGYAPSLDLMAGLAAIFRS